ncbi:MAG: LemA family protein [Actinobacteria bacterium]|nr:LemA family protein [Actinomycetota bacterium]
MDPIMITLTVIGVLVVVVILWFIATYNAFVRLRNLVEEAWRQVDVELHRRYDLLPNLVETVKGYASHERGVFEEVTRARAAAAGGAQTREQQAANENALTAAIGRLFAVAEAYPSLKADANFQALQAELTNTEDRIAGGRRYYNANVREFNTKLETFPASIVGSMTGFRRATYFEAEGSTRDVPRVDFGQGGGSQPGPTAGGPTR